MIVFRFMMRIIRFPFDIVFLTIDFVRLGMYALRCLFARLAGVERPLFGPCMQASFEEVDGEEVGRCSLSVKYGNPFLVRLLCPGAGSDDNIDFYSCGCENSLPLSGARLLLTALVLAGIWGGMLAGGGYLWIRQYGSPFPDMGAAGQEEVVPEAITDDDSRDRATEWVLKGSEAADAGDYSAARMAFRKATDLAPANVDAWIGLGHAAAELDLPAEAADAYRSALELEPEHLTAMVEASAIAVENGNLQRALQLARRAVEVDGEHAGALLQYVRGERLSGDIDAAGEAVRRLMELAPDDPRTGLEMAAVALAKRQLDRAEAGFRRAVDIDPGLIEARVGLAQVLARRGQQQAAIDHLNALIREFPDDETPRIELAELHLRLGNRAEAIQLFGDLSAAFPRRFLLRARYGELLALAGRYDESYVVLNALLKDNPGDAVAHMVLADLFLRRDLPTLADEHITRARAQRPGDVRAYRLQTRILMSQQEYGKAVRILRLLLDQIPTDVEMRMRLAHCLNQTGEVEEAITQLQRVIHLRPDTVGPYLQLAQLYSRERRFADAAGQYRTALRREPTNPAIYNNLALALLDAGAPPDEPLRFAQRARELAPDNPQIADTLAWCYFLSGDAQAADGPSADALEALPREPLIRYHRGAILAKLGRIEEAVVHLREALASESPFPGQSEARALLGELTRKDE